MALSSWSCAAVALACLAAPAPAATDAVPLAGEWAFRLDPDDRGVKETWWQAALPDRIRLPGALQAQGFGNEVTTETPWTGQIVDRSWFTAPEYAPYRQPGNVKVPFWLQPDRHYVGPAWYQREVEVPAAWPGKRVVLTLERPHIQTRVWLDGREIGTQDSLSTPHVHDLGTAVTPGKHRLTVRVDNRLVVDVGVNSHSVSDHTQSNWNGIAGRMDLTATPPVWVEDLRVYPAAAGREVTVKGRLGNVTGQAAPATLKLAVTPAPGGDPLALKDVSLPVAAGGGGFTATLPLGDNAKLWDEFRPNLYKLTATLDNGATAATTFGLRHIAIEDTRFLLNGRPFFVRGTLECCIFPKTGFPPTDVESWRRIIRVCRDHGLNHIRFHSWCPPGAAFAAADELGFTFQVECASWANTSTALGEGKPIDDWLYKEADRILAAYGNHPSFLLFTYGNEPAGKYQQYLAKWVTHYRQKDNRRLVTAAAGWPQIPENQYHLTPDPRVQAWGEGLKSRLNARPPETRTDYRGYVRKRAVPVVSHEIGQWCVYPNFDEIPKYTGYLKPKNFEIFRDSLAARGMLDQARDFLFASGKLQTLCYKEDIESALRTPGMGGFHLLDLHDFPGQGTALVGVLDPFWDGKGYVTPAEFRRFCNSTVPLARLDRRVFTTADALTADLEVAHFGPEPLPPTATAWKLVADDGTPSAAGRLDRRPVPLGNGTALGKITVPLGGLKAPARFRLVVGLEGTPFENDWDVWVYPPAVKADAPPGVTVTSKLDDAALKALDAGGTVVWLPPPALVRNAEPSPTALGFTSIFWNTAWTQRQPPTTLGILCDPKHPALAAFPTDAHGNWQWWYLVSRAAALHLDGLPKDLRPVVQVVDDWVTNRKLGLVVEAKVGRGKLLVSGIDLATGLDANPVARQMRASLLGYAAGPAFDPKVTVTAEQIRRLAK